jgi:hypothetical protein
MITAVVTAPLPKGLTREKYLENTKAIAGRFTSIPGLIRKQFLFDDKNGVAGGVYLWETREQAETCYKGVWRENFMKSMGSEPDIKFFESLVVVDNEQDEIKVAA